MPRGPLLALMLALIAAALSVGPATAQLMNENLLVVQPSGYKVGFQTKKNNMEMTEMVPTAETVDDWTEMVTVQVFHNLKIAPEQFMGGLAERWSASCPNASSAKIADAAENGYPTVLWQLTCPNNPGTGKPELTWFKAVQGNDSFYVVQKAFKFEPSKDQLAPWLSFLKRVQVCDTRAPDHACPMLTPVKPGATR